MMHSCVPGHKKGDKRMSQQPPSDYGHFVDRTIEAKRATSGSVVHAGQSYVGKQGPNYTPGVSAETVGARALWLGSVTLPPHGGRTKAHIHEQHESAFYLISGEEVELYTGDQLQHREVAHPRDFLYIPARMAPAPVNPLPTPA